MLVLVSRAEPTGSIVLLAELTAALDTGRTQVAASAEDMMSPVPDTELVMADTAQALDTELVMAVTAQALDTELATPDTMQVALVQVQADLVQADLEQVQAALVPVQVALVPAQVASVQADLAQEDLVLV